MKTGAVVVGVTMILTWATGCDPVGKVSARFRVTTTADAEAVAGACVAVDHPSRLEPSFTEQGRTDEAGRVDVALIEVLHPLSRTPWNHPWLVRVDDRTTVEIIEIEHEDGASGGGEHFTVELLSKTFDRENLSSTNTGCDG